MSGKAKSCYLSITNNITRKIIFNKVFFKMADLNNYIKTEEFLKLYPTTEFTIYKEIY